MKAKQLGIELTVKAKAKKAEEKAKNDRDWDDMHPFKKFLIYLVIGPPLFLLFIYILDSLGL